MWYYNQALGKRVKEPSLKIRDDKHFQNALPGLYGRGRKRPLVVHFEDGAEAFEDDEMQSAVRC